MLAKNLPWPVVDPAAKVPFKQRPLAERPPIAITDEVCAALARGAVVAIGVSGGKDSDAAAIATNRYLNQIGHAGKRVLIHADLGRVEWAASLPTCERLAQHLGLPLLVARRQAGDLLARWMGRWANNVVRYRDLSCVKLILPWSTPAMRYCTSELKCKVVAQHLRALYPTQEIVSVSGIRRQESEDRKKAPVSKVNADFKRKGAALALSWNPVLDYLVEDVFGEIGDAGLALHPSYTEVGTSRASCMFCIMSALRDLEAAVKAGESHDLYRALVQLEVTSTFGFQGNRWLGDLAPELLAPEVRDMVGPAKQAARAREAAERRIPKHLYYTKGWPTVMPTCEEAQVIAEVRREVADLMGFEVGCTSAETVLARYSELMTAKALRDADDAAKETRRQERAAARAAKASQDGLGEGTSPVQVVTELDEFSQSDDGDADESGACRPTCGATCGGG